MLKRILLVVGVLVAVVLAIAGGFWARSALLRAEAKKVTTPQEAKTFAAKHGLSILARRSEKPGGSGLSCLYMRFPLLVMAVNEAFDWEFDADNKLVSFSTVQEVDAP